MAMATEDQSKPAVKTCEACGEPYARKANVCNSQWQRSRACSRGCALAIGRRDRVWPDIAARMAAKTDKTPGHGPQGECWLWTGSTIKAGYGSIKCDGKIRKAHRVALMLAGVTVPATSFVLHACDNPSCVNPAHLKLGSHADNMADMVAKGRGDAPRGECHHEAVLDEDGVRSIRRDPRPNREIATEFGVTPAAIWLIKNRRNWRHVA